MFGRRQPQVTEIRPEGVPTAEEETDDVIDLNEGDAEQIWEPVKAPARKTVDQLLLERGHVSEEQIDQARKVQSQTPGKTLTQVLLNMNAASEAQTFRKVRAPAALPYDGA